LTKNETLKLIDEFGSAALRAGQSSSGACYDPGAPSLWNYMQKLRKRLQDDILRERETLLGAVKYAYRKHHLGDQNIGWDELSDILQQALCETMTDKGYQEWVEKNKP
jgi:hypothetical protein